MPSPVDFDRANADDFNRSVMNAPVKTHLLVTCLARRGGRHAVTTLGVFKTLSDDERCEWCADLMRRHEDMNKVKRAC